MNMLLDDLLVGMLLLLSAGYVFSALGPRNLRRRVLVALSAWLARVPAVLGVRRAAQRIAQAAETKPHGACGGCDNCAAESAEEIKVPMSKIGRVRR